VVQAARLRWCPRAGEPPAPRQDSVEREKPTMSKTFDVAPPAAPLSAQEAKLARRASRKLSLFDPALVKTALWQAVVMLRPDIQWKNPVMFVVEVGTVLSLI